MTNADRIQRWNLWYERTPPEWRFQLVLWTLLIVGAVNMLLTIAVGFPFALLIGLAIAAMAVVRVPYALGWIRTGGEASAGAGGDTRLEIAAPSWVLRVNRWYDGLDEMQRALVLAAALAIPGAINMLLTFAGVFPFGLLFLLAVLAVLAVRAPYAAGWYKEQPGSGAPTLTAEPQAPRLGDESVGVPFTAGSRPADGAPGAAENQPLGARLRAADARPTETSTG